MAALIGGEHAGVVGLAVDHVAVVADLVLLDDAVAAAADVDAHGLLGCAVLAFLAAQVELLAERAPRPET